MNLGRTIKLCRKNSGLTQAQLAVLAGISVPHLCLMEQNKRGATVATLEAIAKALKIPLSILIFLAAQHDEIKELDGSQIEELSSNIMRLINETYRQETLF